MKALAAIVLLAGAAHAQSPGEISFWESVRDSKNAEELRAYLQRYPDGAFVPLARARIAALERGPAPAAAPAAASAAPGKRRMPVVGDTWTYRLSYPRLRGQWGQPGRPPSSHVVTVKAVQDDKIIDEISVDGGAPIASTHSAQAYLAPQGVSVFAPYLIAFRDLPGSGSTGSITILDTPCNGQFGCRASGRFLGPDVITVAGKRTQAIKVLIEESWWPASAGVGNATLGRMNGGRRLTVWYAPELGRAVKYESRPTVGDVPPVEQNFDLELVSYELK